MEKNENPRLKMLGLLTKEENSLVLYDALSTRDFARFSYFIDKGYAINAFILNCMIDFGFEKNIEFCVRECQRHDNNIYEFMVAYLGQEKAEAFFVGNNFNNLMANKFSDETIEKHQLWEVAFLKKSYELLIKNKQYDLIRKAMAGKDSGKIADILLKEQEFDFLLELGWDWKISDSYEGQKYLWDTKNWKEFFRLRFNDQLIASGWGKSASIEQVYLSVVNAGGTDALYEYSYITKEYLLKSGLTAPFIQAKDWCSLYHAGFYKEINLDDWWTENTSDVVIKAVIKTAINAKNWDFLEQRKCLWALFKNFRWQRSYRIWRS